MMFLFAHVTSIIDPPCVYNYYSQYIINATLYTDRYSGNIYYGTGIWSRDNNNPDINRIQLNLNEEQQTKITRLNCMLTLYR